MLIINDTVMNQRDKHENDIKLKMHVYSYPSILNISFACSIEPPHLDGYFEFH